MKWLSALSFNKSNIMPMILNVSWTKINFHKCFPETTKISIRCASKGFHFDQHFQPKINENKRKDGIFNEQISNRENNIQELLLNEDSPFSDIPTEGKYAEMFNEIADGDREILNELQTLENKLSVATEYFDVKPELTKDQWIEILKLSESKRKSYISYLIKKCFYQKKKIEEREKKKMEFDIDLDNEEDDFLYDDPLCYHLFHNSLTLKVRGKTLKNFYCGKTITSMMYGPDLLLDCSYEDYMTPVEIRNLASQINDSIGINMKYTTPFHLVFCNFNRNGVLGKCISRYALSFYNSDYPITVSEKSYLDLYPKEQLVYLTPHCNNVLTTFDANKKYIIGAYVDKHRPQPVSLAKAKENNLAMAKFPLDKYLNWGIGKKTLTINHTVVILASLINNGGDWAKAFEVIPKRFLLSADERNRMTTLKKKSKLNSAVEFILRYM